MPDAIPSREAKLERLAQLSTDPDSLDWDVLANVDELAWGAHDDGHSEDTPSSQSGQETQP